MKQSFQKNNIQWTTKFAKQSSNKFKKLFGKITMERKQNFREQRKGNFQKAHKTYY
jgi:hypothetical protein